MDKLSLNLLNKDNASTIVDFDIEGGVNSKGQLTKLYGQEALNNAIKIWLESQKGDFYGFPERGGHLIKILSKEMSDQVQQELIAVIRNTLTIEFDIPLVINEIKVIPDYGKRTWSLKLDITAPTLNLRTSLSSDLDVL